MNKTQHHTTGNTHLQTWVSREFKKRFAQVAKAQGLSESALLRSLLEKVVLADRAAGEELITRVEELPSACRVSVRLRPDHLLFLRERATARALPTSTYISYLVRSHLRAQAPLPTIALTVRRAPEVVVKVSGGASTLGGVQAHLAYIGREGKLGSRARANSNHFGRP